MRGGKVIFWQIIANFADFRQSNSVVFIGKKVHLKNINSKKSSFFDNQSQILDEICDTLACLWRKNRLYREYQLPEKFIFRLSVVKKLQILPSLSTKLKAAKKEKKVFKLNFLKNFLMRVIRDKSKFLKMGFCKSRNCTNYDRRCKKN